MAYIVSGGEISSGIVLDSDYMTVLDGGVAETTTVNGGGRLYVSAGGTVTLWFMPEYEDLVVWDEISRSCTDGENSVIVKGAAPVTLKFGGTGDDAAMFAALSEAGAFEGATSRKIFEGSTGLLA